MPGKTKMKRDKSRKRKNLMIRLKQYKTLPDIRSRLLAVKIKIQNKVLSIIKKS